MYNEIRFQVSVPVFNNQQSVSENFSEWKLYLTSDTLAKPAVRWLNKAELSWEINQNK